MVGFDVELERELTVDGLNELAQMCMQVAKLPRGLSVLVATRYGHERDVALGAQGGGDRLADIPLVANTWRSVWPRAVRCRRSGRASSREPIQSRG